MPFEALLINAARAAATARESSAFFGLLDSAALAPASSFRVLSKNLMPNVIFHAEQAPEAMVYSKDALSLFRATPTSSEVWLKTPTGMQAFMTKTLGEDATLRLQRFGTEQRLTWTSSEPLTARFPASAEHQTMHGYSIERDLVVGSDGTRLLPKLDEMPVRQILGERREIGKNTFLTMHSSSTAKLEMPGLEVKYTPNGTKVLASTIDDAHRPLKFSFAPNNTFEGFTVHPEGSRLASLTYNARNGASAINVPQDPFLKDAWRFVLKP